MGFVIEGTPGRCLESYGADEEQTSGGAWILNSVMFSFSRKQVIMKITGNM